LLAVRLGQRPKLVASPFWAPRWRRI